MVRTCCVQGCTTKSHDGKGRRLNPGVRFFSFPGWKRSQGPQVEEITKRRRMAWVSAVRRKDITFSKIPPSICVCSRHFHKGQPAYEMMETDPDWAPSLLLGHSELKPTNPERAERQRRRRQQKKIKPKPDSSRAHQHGENNHHKELQHEAGESGELNIVVIKNEPEESVQEWKFETVEGRLLDITVTERKAGEGVQEDTSEWTYETGASVQLDAKKVVKCEDEDEESGQLGVKVDKHKPEGRGQVNTASGGLAQTECSKCVLRIDEINRLLEENRALRRELSEYKISDGFFGNDDGKVQYYTGMPNLATFMVLLNFLAPLMTHKKVLTPFQKLLLTFMRLKLDLPVQHLAHLFRVSEITVSRTFSDMILFLCTNLRHSIAWPDRDALMKMMPNQFAEVFRHQAVVIIDDFEISAEKPSDPKARTQMFSSTKNSYTMKYLMGITPNGSVCFLSKGWGGCTTDRCLIEGSGLLDCLMPGDVVLSVQGFGLQEGVGMLCAEVKRPPLTSGSGQLAIRTVEETRRIEHLKVHVKKVMKNISERYKILSVPIPSNMILPCAGVEDTFLDKIVTVCCALLNRCPTVL